MPKSTTRTRRMQETLAHGGPAPGPMLQLTNLSTSIRHILTARYGSMPISARPSFYRRENFGGQVTYG